MDFTAIIDDLKADLRAETQAAVQAAILACLPELIRRSRLPLYLNSGQLSELTGWSRRKIAYLKAERRLPFIRRGRTVLFRTADVEAFLDEGLVEAWAADEVAPEDVHSRVGPHSTRVVRDGAALTGSSTSHYLP